MKKGQEELGFVFGLVLIFLVLLGSFVLFNAFGKGEVKAKVDALSNDESNINLLNYLRSFDQKSKLIVSDLIVYSYYNKDYKEITRFTEEFLEKYHDKEKCQTIVINAFLIKDNSRLFQQISLGDVNGDFHLRQSSVIIPTLNEDKIKVNYAEGCINE